MVELATYELVRAAAAGEEAAGRALFERFHARIFAYCLVAARYDRDDASDLTQQVFAAAFSKLRRLRDPAKFEPWLYTIARRACADRGAWRARERALLSCVELESEVCSALPEDKVLRERRIQVVRELLEEVEDDLLRRIVLMRYTHPEHTTREIARALGVPHGTVTVKLMRFRASFKAPLMRALRERALLARGEDV